VLPASVSGYQNTTAAVQAQLLLLTAHTARARGEEACAANGLYAFFIAPALMFVK
jgi:hypothetical protein